MDGNHRMPPYPVSNSLDPLESLDELERSRNSYLSYSSAPQFHVDANSSLQQEQLSPFPGPPLPTRPPQHIIDQHIPPNRYGSSPINTVFDTPDAGPHHSISSTRLHGPRNLPSRFSNSNLNSVVSGDVSSLYTPPRVQQAPYPIDTSVNPQRYDQFASSPTDSRDNYFSRHLSANAIQPSSSPLQPYYSSPSFRRSPERNSPLPIRTNGTQFDSYALQDSPISAMPDVPQLTPNSLYSTSSFNERRYSTRSQNESPSPSSKGGLYGPRSRPSRNSLNQGASLSVSPNKRYYDHRTSWKSEYSVNVIDTDDEEDNDLFDEAQDLNLPSETSNGSTTNDNHLMGIESVVLPNAVTTKVMLDKELPSVPTEFQLPTLPFSSRSLKDQHFSKCSNIALLSEIFQWSITLSEEWSEGLLITEQEYKKSLRALLTNKVSNIRPFLIEKHINGIMLSFEKQNSIYVDENDNIHFFSNIQVQGVLPTLTPCYSYLHVHSPITSYKCYSSRCPLTITKPPIPQAPPEESGAGKIGEWVSYWNLSAQDLQELDNDEVKKQSHIFELIRQQQNIINLGEIQVKIYGQSFKTTTPQLLPDVSKFYNDAFNSVKPLVELHRKHLLEPLIHKLNTQGKYLSGIGEIFLNFSKICAVQYMKYTEQMASVRELIKFEKARNSRFNQWLLSIDSHPQVTASSLDHNRVFFSGFTGHTQSLSLVLDSVFKKTKESDEDHHFLRLAIEAIGNLNRKIDETQGIALESRELRILSNQLIWKSNLLETDLKLSEPQRKIIKRGTTVRKDKWAVASTQLILLDNYLLITDQQRDNHIKMTEKPIPIEFLQVETKDLPQLQPPTIDAPVENESKYSFIIRHAGQNLSYRFFSASLSEREEWIKSFNKVKQTKGNVKTSETCEISVLSDQFQYPDGQQPQKLPICVPGSNIDLLLKNFQNSIELQFDELSISRPVMVSEVLCGTTIKFQGQSFHVLGLNFGLFITEASNPRGWKRVLGMNKITQVDQLQDLLILISDKGLYHFSLVSLLLNYYDLNSDGAIVGERLSKHGVSWFKIGIYYNTTLLFILKAPVQSSIAGPKFKVFSPVFDRSGQFTQFQLYKKFQVSTDCYDVSIFNSMFVLHTSKGFEILTFQVLNESQLIPKFIESSKKPKTEIEQIKKSLKSGNCKPLKIVKVPYRPQFYLIYDTFAMVIDTIGQLISDKFIFPFKFKCSWVSIQEEFLICIGKDIVEVFNLSYDEVDGFESFDPVQIITGKDIKLLDEKNSKICIAHPVIPGRQLVLQLDKV